LVSLGGGPGFELLTAQWFLRYWGEPELFTYLNRQYISPPLRYRLRLVSLGGGPGFELLAAQWFLRYWACVVTPTN